VPLMTAIPYLWNIACLTMTRQRQVHLWVVITDSNEGSADLLKLMSTSPGGVQETATYRSLDARIVLDQDIYN